MSDQLDLLANGSEPSWYRVNALANVIAGFVAPGYDDSSKLPKRVKEPCRTIARGALVDALAAIPPEHRQPRKRGST